MTRSLRHLSLLIAASLPILAIAAVPVPVPATEAVSGSETVRFYGYAFDLKTDRYLYTEAHRQRFENGRWTEGAIRYYAPDGTLLGNKTLDFSRDPYIPVYRLDLPKTGYFESITAVGAQIEMAKRGARGEAIKTASVPRTPPICGDSGFHVCLYDNFPALLAGKPLNFLFAVAGNLDSYRFRAKRIGDGQFDGKTVVRFRVEPDSALRFFVDALEVSYDPQLRKLLEYRGVSNVHDPATGKAYIARIAYYDRPPAVAGTLPPLP